MLDLADVHKGCPDILVGRAGRNYLLEIKDGSKPPSARALTPAEAQFHHNWRGHRAVVTSRQEALREIGLAD